MYNLHRKYFFNEQCPDKFKKLLLKEKNLIYTKEKDFSHEKCKSVGMIIENYIRMILSTETSDEKNLSFTPIIENIKKYVESNLEYNINILHLSKIFHYNEKYLGRLFKNHTGISINEYINKKRIELAKILLLETNDKIIDISIRVGYNNVTYFNLKFKKYYNVSPIKFRKNKGIQAINK